MTTPLQAVSAHLGLVVPQAPGPGTQLTFQKDPRRIGTLRLSNTFDVVGAVLPALTRPLPQGGFQWTPYEAAARLYDEVEIRTTATPPMVMDVRSMADPTPNPVLQKLRPTIIFRGPAGERIIAPYGDAGTGGKDTAMFLVGMVGVVALGIGFTAGRGSARVIRTRDIRRQRAVAGLGASPSRRKRRRSRR